MEPATPTGGSRRFLRYGYGDLLREDRRYGVWHRIWPGTQRHLLWGDPALAAGYGRASSFCGSDGIDLCEPLSFKGRIGSGVPGGRNAYSEKSLDADAGDWCKHIYTYRLWGRLLYNPETEPEVWRRFLRKRFQAGAPALENALAHASGVHPLVTTSHGLSGSNNAYWPEMYTIIPIVDASRRHPYGDTPSPKRFGKVSTFDPELFSGVDEFVDEILGRTRSGRYSPLRLAGAAASEDRAKPVVAEALGRVRPATVVCRHTPAAQFVRGKPLVVELAVPTGKAAGVRIHYRYVNQAERYVVEEMRAEESRYRATIPATYTESPYPLQYFFTVHEGPDAAWLYPGFRADLSNQPYFVVRSLS